MAQDDIVLYLWKRRVMHNDDSFFSLKDIVHETHTNYRAMFNSITGLVKFKVVETKIVPVPGLDAFYVAYRLSPAWYRFGEILYEGCKQ